MSKTSENSAQFSLGFQGEGTSLDVKELATTLLGFSDLFDELNTLVNANTAKVRLRLSPRGTTPEGELGLELVQFEKPQLQLEGSRMLDAVELVETAEGLYSLLGFLEGRRPSRVSTKGDVVTIEVEGQARKVPRSVAQAAESPSVREAAEKCAKVLKNDRTTGLTLTREGRQETLVRKGLVDTMFLPLEEAEERLVTTFTREVALTVVAPNFRDGNKWRFSDGSSDVWASITDAEFLKEIEAHRVTFGKNDVLLCQVSVTQWQTRTGLKSDTIITRVEKRVPAMKQLTLLGAD